MNQSFICYITYTDSLEGYWTNYLKTFTTHARLDLEFNQRGIDEWSLVWEFPLVPVGKTISSRPASLVEVKSINLHKTAIGFKV